MYREGKFIKPTSETDYAYMWWAYGLRGVSPEGRRILAVRTGKYGMAFDVEQASLTMLGTFDHTTPIHEALVEENDVVMNLPPSKLKWNINQSGVIYCHTGGEAKEDTRIVESGRFVQRFDMVNIRFKDDSETCLDVKARLEVAVLSDYTVVIFEWSTQKDMIDVQLTVQMELSSEDFIHSAVSNAPGDKVFTELNESHIMLKPSVSHWKAGETYQLALQIAPIHSELARESLSFIQPLAEDRVKARAYKHVNEDDQKSTKVGFVDAVSVEYDQARGWYQIHLPDQLNEVGTNDPKHYERIRMELSNPYPFPKRMPLLFLKEEGIMSITGLSPMIRDGEGNPTGLPVQISKNWHGKNEDAPPYSGGWFHGFTLLELPPTSTVEMEFTMAYSYWGGVPAASHAQLCLIGWGGNQLWEQAAIGSWGESITYDPDVGLDRSMIDDVRPLMVTAFGGRKYGWTENVGGGDFLVHYNFQNQKQYLTRMRTWHKNYGPNLSEVTYSGITNDGHIYAEFTVSTPRTDDINRVYHRARYKVLKPTPVIRTSFYSVGAEHYNNHTFIKMACGNAEGLLEEWEPNADDSGYERNSTPIQGKNPWFSLHEGIPGSYYDDKKYLQDGAAWANRGLVIRSWEAQIEGKQVPIPYYSVYRTRDQGVKSVNLELCSPPETKMLLPGDYIEFDVELLILPQCPEDYYGPNVTLRESLEHMGNTWKLVHCQAVGNHLSVHTIKGTVTQRHPMKINVDRNQEAEFEVTGGVAYVPFTFIGLKRYWGGVLEQWTDDGWIPVDQSQIGNDYWQTFYDQDKEEWEITFNIFMDSQTGTAVFRFYI